MYVFNISYPATLPSNYGHVLKEYRYDQLMEMKLLLNEAKSKIDPIYKTSKKEYQEFMYLIYPYRVLKEILVSSIGSYADSEFDKETLEKMVTKAHLKIRELLKFIEPDIKKIKEENFKMVEKDGRSKRVKKCNNLITFHIAEAPGAFVPAMYTFIDGFRFNWEWYAESYVDIYSKNSRYLGDQFAFMDKTKKHWLRGADSDGDITSPANLISFNHFFRNLDRPFLDPNMKLKKYLNSGGDSILCDIVTSDVKYVPERKEYTEEESQNYPVQLGQVITSLLCNKTGGMCILKFFTLFESTSMSLMWLLCSQYKEVYVTKPVTSTQTNSEIYVVCKGLHDRPNKNLIKYLLNCLDKARVGDILPLFEKSNIPEEFVSLITNCMREISSKQIESLNEVISMFREVRNKPNIEQIDEVQKKLAQEWIEYTKPSP
jgi:23S rRNA U2552 (ribose-2'-O)-methylase RlmE/FtsJ